MEQLLLRLRMKRIRKEKRQGQQEAEQSLPEKLL
jgi:hypothetical protein